MSVKEVCLNDLIGKPYKNGGRGDGGYDCVGLVIEIYKRLGFDVPNYLTEDIEPSLAQKLIEEAKENGTLIKHIEPQIYDIIIIKQHFLFTQHLAVYIGCGKFIHATEHLGVSIDYLSNKFYKDHIKGFYGYVG